MARARLGQIDLPDFGMPEELIALLPGDVSRHAGGS